MHKPPIRKLPRLFDDVSQEAYAKAIELLDDMRKQHPGYDDNRLLLKLLCVSLGYKLTSRAYDEESRN